MGLVSGLIKCTGGYPAGFVMLEIPVRGLN